MHEGMTNHAANASDIGLEPLIERAFFEMLTTNTKVLGVDSWRILCWSTHKLQLIMHGGG
jgi:hypothetical protein